MLFDDSREKIVENLLAYAEKGCVPYRAKFSHVDEFNRFVAPDRKELEHIYTMVGKNCVTAFYDDNVDTNFSGLNKRVHNGNLLYVIANKLGKKSKQFIKNVGIKDVKWLAKVMYGTTYHPMIRDMGKDTMGLCLSNANDCLVLYSSNASPIKTLHNFYHEVGHAMANKLNLNQNDESALNILKDKLEKAPENKKAMFAHACKKEQEYLKYMNESYAEVFATMMTLLRTKTEAGYLGATEALLDYAANRNVQGLGCNSDVAAYNAFRAVKQVIAMLDNMNRRNRVDIAKVNGRFSLDKVAKMAFEINKNALMSREEYNNYRSGNINQANRGYGWEADTQEARAFVEINRDKLALVEMGERLTVAKSRRQIYDVFHRYSAVVPEAVGIYEVYKQNNIKARAYDKLRKAQEFLGVDKLFGKFARARRSLGAKIMNKVKGGRD